MQQYRSRDASRNSAHFDASREPGSVFRDVCGIRVSSASFAAAAATMPRMRAGSAGFVRWSSKPASDDELRPVAQPRAPGLDVAAVALRDGADERQSETEAAGRRPPPFDLHEDIEDRPQVLGSRPDARVGHAQDRAAALRPRAELDAPARWCELRGVVEEIPDGLGEPRRNWLLLASARCRAAARSIASASARR